MELQPENRPQTIQKFLDLLLPKPVQKSPRRDVIYNVSTPINNVPTPLPKKDDLSSDRGVDYSKLRDLLKAGKWKEADQETVEVMCEAANRSKEGWLRDKDIDNFPCTDLLTINQLWLNYSGGKFGFSVQKEIYYRLGGTREYNEEVWEAFGDAVGWRKGRSWLNYKDITFNTSALSGHLPKDYLQEYAHYAHLVGWGVWERCDHFFSRFETCKL